MFFLSTVKNREGLVGKVKIRTNYLSRCKVFHKFQLIKTVLYFLSQELKAKVLFIKWNTL